MGLNTSKKIECPKCHSDYLPTARATDNLLAKEKNMTETKIQLYLDEVKEFINQKPVTMQLTPFVEELVKWSFAAALCLGAQMESKGKLSVLTSNERDVVCNVFMKKILSLPSETLNKD